MLIPTNRKLSHRRCKPQTAQYNHTQAIIIIVIIPIIFALFLNEKIVIVIKRKYSNTNHAVKPICNASTDSDFATALQTC